MDDENAANHEALRTGLSQVPGSNYAAARARHAIAREIAYEAARLEAMRLEICGPEFRVTDIDAHTLSVWKNTWTGVHPSGAGGWNWPGLVERLPHRAAVLPMALWHGQDLCGLSLGHLSRRRASGVRHTVTLTYLERRPEPPPVVLRGQVALLAITAARNYGVARGARRMRLRYPDRRLIEYYRTLGFDIVWEGVQPVYCEQEI